MNPANENFDIWRISTYRTLDGVGGFHASGRWHTAGRHVVYLTESVASAMLEVLVHLPLDDEIPDSYRLLRVRVPQETSITFIQPPKTIGWQNDLLATQKIGNAWLEASKAPLARIPSVIIPHTWNYLLNPAHPDAGKISIIDATDSVYDPRLLRVRR